MTTVTGTCDVLVVGGGINGAGIARDAAGRGLRTVLCEQHDLASHTSSASTKLVGEPVPAKSIAAGDSILPATSRNSCEPAPSLNALLADSTTAPAPASATMWSTIT